MTIKEVVTRAVGLPYKELCSALIERFGVRQPVKWDRGPRPVYSLFFYILK